MRIFALLLLVPALFAAPEDAAWQKARANGAAAENVFARTRRMVDNWLTYADPQTLLLPDYLPGRVYPNKRANNAELIYTPHNSGADNYPYLIITSFFTAPELYRRRMMDMLRNEIRYTNVSGAIPGNFDLKTRKLGPPSLFGAGEYCKDGLLSVTELLGRTPWYYRMVDIMQAFMERAPVKTRFGNLPDTGAELNGDVLQTLVRVAPMSGDPRFLHWAEQIADAYVEEILPRNQWLPGYRYDFEKQTDTGATRLRDHGNEAIVGLTLLHALETDLGRPRAQKYLPAVRKMLDRVLASANPDGMLFSEVRNDDLKPAAERLSDNWGYVYGAVYTFYQVTGEARYRDAVLHVLRNLPKYRKYDWENGSMDGYADSIEGALYLVAREPVPEALDWIESEMKTLIAYQRDEGAIERWYGDGNWNRTLLLYAMMKTQGCYPADWRPGVAVGAVREGETLRVTVQSRDRWAGRLRFDYARHRRVLNYAKNYVRLNEWPEWYAVDENTLYAVEDPDTGKSELRLGSELKEGLPLALAPGAAARRIVKPAK